MPGFLQVRSNFMKAKKNDGSIPMSGDLEADTVAWIEVLTFHSRRRGQTYHAWLQDGVILCELANVIKPGIIETIHPPDATVLKRMENTTKFVRACRILGVMEEYLFDTVDLYKGSDLGLVPIAAWQRMLERAYTIPRIQR